MQILVLGVCALATYCSSHDVSDFDDSILYKIDFPGLGTDALLDENKFEPLIATTSDKEQYRCAIPIALPAQEAKPTLEESSLTPYQVISQLFSTTKCLYRSDAYWSYEICHGHHVRQYHEERDGRTTKLQEFYLGQMDDPQRENFRKESEEEYAKRKLDGKVQKLAIDNVKYPVFEARMSDGTLCDLNNQPRSIVIRYICFPTGKNEFYSLKETSSCNYEAIVLTSALCLHPMFAPEDSKETTISCLPVGNAPQKPYKHLRNEMEDLQHRLDAIKQAAQTATQVKDSIAIIKIGKDVRLGFIKEGGRVMEIDVEPDETPADAEPPTEKSASLPRFGKSPDDTTPIKDFLSGKVCLVGGTGWWNFEFCYGEYVRQFHVDKDSETSLILGHFNEHLHREYMKLHPEKRPKLGTPLTGVTHFYQGGTVCDKTGEKRQVEVKLKCFANAPTTSTVSIYLLEPKTCQYILVVESAIICDLLHMVDEDGLVPQMSTVKRLRKVPSTMVIDDITVRHEND